MAQVGNNQLTSVVPKLMTPVESRQANSSPQHEHAEQDPSHRRGGAHSLHSSACRAPSPDGQVGGGVSDALCPKPAVRILARARRSTELRPGNQGAQTQRRGSGCQGLDRVHVGCHLLDLGLHGLCGRPGGLGLVVLGASLPPPSFSFWLRGCHVCELLEYR